MGRIHGELLSLIAITHSVTLYAVHSPSVGLRLINKALMVHNQQSEVDI